MHQATQIIPLIHTTHVYAITHAERHSFGQIDVVCDQQAASIAYVNDEPLVPRAIIIIRQQAAHEASDLYPATVIALLVRLVHPMPFLLFLGQTPIECHKKRGKPFLVCRVSAFC